MKIYKAEIEAGISEQVKSMASVCFCSEIKPTESQPDLHPIKSVLVSTGWNKNGDVFDRAETYKAKSSPINKKINFEHNENDIIGHITNAYVVDDDYKEISLDEVEESKLPDFNIITEGVLYTYWEDETSRARMNQVIAEMSEDKWFISMECIFKEFDYAVAKGSDNYVIKRNEETAFLTKTLKAYGGTGEYEGYKIGRLFRDFTFSGKALVKNPANEKSVILSTASTFDPIETKENFDFSKSSVHIIEEIDMSDELEQIKKELAEAKEAIQAKASAELIVRDEKIKNLETQLSTASIEKETVGEKLAQAEELINTLKSQLEEAEAAKKVMMEEKDKMAKKAKCSERLAKTVAAGVPEEDAAKAAEKWLDVADDIYEEYVTALSFKYKTNETVVEPEVEVEEVEQTVASTDEVEKNDLVEKAAAWFMNKKEGK